MLGMILRSPQSYNLLFYSLRSHRDYLGDAVSSRRYYAEIVTGGPTGVSVRGTPGSSFLYISVNQRQCHFFRRKWSWWHLRRVLQLERGFLLKG